MSDLFLLTGTLQINEEAGTGGCEIRGRRQGSPLFLPFLESSELAQRPDDELFILFSLIEQINDEVTEALTYLNGDFNWCEIRDVFIAKLDCNI